MATLPKSGKSQGPKEKAALKAPFRRMLSALDAHVRQDAVHVQTATAASAAATVAVAEKREEEEEEDGELNLLPMNEELNGYEEFIRPSESGSRTVVPVPASVRGKKKYYTIRELLLERGVPAERLGPGGDGPPGTEELPENHGFEDLGSEPMALHLRRQGEWLRVRLEDRFLTPLYPHQWIGVAHGLLGVLGGLGPALNRRLRRAHGALLGDEMGVGKTLQMLGIMVAREWVAELEGNRDSLPPCWALVPGGSIGNVVREAHRRVRGFEEAPGTVFVYHGPERHWPPPEGLRRTRLVVTTAHTVLSELREIIDRSDGGATRRGGRGRGRGRPTLSQLASRAGSAQSGWLARGLLETDTDAVASIRRALDVAAKGGAQDADEVPSWLDGASRPPVLFVDEVHMATTPGTRLSLLLRALPRDSTVLMSGTLLRNRAQEVLVLLSMLDPQGTLRRLGVSLGARRIGRVPGMARQAKVQRETFFLEGAGPLFRSFLIVRLKKNTVSEVPPLRSSVVLDPLPAEVRVQRFLTRQFRAAVQAAEAAREDEGEEGAKDKARKTNHWITLVSRMRIAATNVADVLQPARLPDGSERYKACAHCAQAFPERAPGGLPSVASSPRAACGHWMCPQCWAEWCEETGGSARRPCVFCLEGARLDEESEPDPATGARGSSKLRMALRLVHSIRRSKAPDRCIIFASDFTKVLHTLLKALRAHFPEMALFEPPRAARWARRRGDDSVSSSSSSDVDDEDEEEDVSSADTTSIESESVSVTSSEDSSDGEEEEEEEKEEGPMIFMYTGEMSMRLREQTLVRFESAPPGSILLLSARAGGVALNLQRASCLFQLDGRWTRAAEEQLDARVHRLGQERKVYLLELMLRHSIDVALEKVRDDKAILAEILDGSYSRERRRRGGGGAAVDDEPDNDRHRSLRTRTKHQRAALASHLMRELTKAMREDEKEEEEEEDVS